MPIIAIISLVGSLLGAVAQVLQAGGTPSTPAGWVGVAAAALGTGGLAAIAHAIPSTTDSANAALIKDANALQKPPSSVAAIQKLGA